MLAHDLRWALDPVTWAREALSFEPDAWQAAVLRSDAARQLLLCSRQSGKSTVAALCGLHLALYRPGALILLLSRSLRQSGELFRRVMAFYNALAPTVAPESETVLRLELTNGSRIVSLPGSEATLRGYSGVALLVVDEAARVPDALYYAVRPMLAVSAGRLVCMSTPFGKQGFFFHEATEGAPDWARVLVTAQECPRITPEFLAQERRDLPDRVYRREYGCEFLELEDAVFSYADFAAAISTEVEPLFGGIRP